MNRSADWLHQAHADLAQASLSAEAFYHEWACFASHQAVEKALKALHLQQRQQSWGHGWGAPTESCLRRLLSSWPQR